MLKLLYVYKWATLGGVERVLLNRAEAFRTHGIPCRIYVWYLEEGGAIESFRSYIQRRGLDDFIAVVSSPAGIDYDYLISIDTPEVLAMGIDLANVFFECHTQYTEARKYLGTLPEEIKCLAVPSTVFKEELELEHPQLKGKVVVIRNYVPDCECSDSQELPHWVKRPLLYLGRMDTHKNVRELLDIFAAYKAAYGDELFLLLAGPYPLDVNLYEEIATRGLADRTVLLPAVQFDRANEVYGLVRRHKGIFVSCSRAESFGLSVAEAMCAGLPVLLSGNQGHAALVNHDMNFLYPLGQTREAVRKLRAIVDDYDSLIERVKVLSRPLQVESFLDDWQVLMDQLRI